MTGQQEAALNTRIRMQISGQREGGRGLEEGGREGVRGGREGGG